MSLHLILGMQPQVTTSEDTRWDLTYYSHSGDLYSGSNIYPPGVGGTFSADGTKFYNSYISGSSGALVEIDLATPWDISSMATNGYVLLTDANNWPRDVQFKPDGTKMYLKMGKSVSFPLVKEYNLSTPWSISTAVDSGNSFNPSNFYNADRATFTTYGFSFAMRDDGVTTIQADVQTDTMYEVTMSTAWNISTANFTSASYYPSTYTQPFGVSLKYDGTKMYIGDQSAAEISEYTLSTPWDISTVTDESRSIDYGSEVGPIFVYKFIISDDGQYAVALDGGLRTNAVGYGYTRYEYTGNYTKPRLPYDLEYVTQTANSHSFGFDPGGIRFKSDGTKAYVNDRDTDRIRQFSLSTAWDSSTMTEDKSYYIGLEDNLGNGLFLKPDGTEMYLAGGNTDTIYQYSLSSSWDIGSATLSGSLSVTSQQGLPTDVWFTSDGTVMIVVGTVGEPIDKYTLSQAWTVASATHDSNTTLTHLANAPGANYGAWSIDFNTAGDEFVISGYSPYNNIQQYSLGASLDFTTTTFQYSKILPIYQGGAGNPYGITFGNSGTKLYVCSSDDNTLYEYNLT